MPSEEQGVGARLAGRYAPFVLFLAVQLIIILVAPSTGTSPQTAAGITPGSEFSTPGPGVLSSDSNSPANPSAPGIAGITPGVNSPTVGTGPSPTQGYISDDLSRCAKGGVLQQDVTRISPLCVGKWIGENGGATYRGVTRERIRVVFARVSLPEIVEPIFVAGNLGTTREQDAEHIAVWAKFFEKHYEWYGRKIEWILHEISCDTADPNVVACMRQEARRIQKKHDPFLVFATQVAYAEFWDELARLRVVGVGGQVLPGSFNAARRPFHWDVFTDTEAVALNLADYWCKRMRGKPARFAGDPALQPQTRTLGVLAEQAVSAAETFTIAARFFSRLVSGERCGTADDEPVTITYINDAAQASNQMSAAATSFRQAGVTTVVCLCSAITPVFMTQAFDDQRFFPEHLVAGVGAIDIDQIGRLYSQSQWRNAFGPSFWAETVPFGDSDAVRAWQDTGRDDRPCLVCGSIHLYMEPVAVLLQWGGPNLTPESIELGALNAPPIGGWKATGHDPEVPMWQFGPGDYTAFQDARQVYWDPAAVSKGDGQTGAYVAVDGGKRYEIARWTKGGPKQP